MTHYDKKFYDDHKDGSLRSARILLPEFFRHYRPHSIIDVGCGSGAWLRAAQELGVGDILGLDGDYVDEGTLYIDKHFFQAHDLNTPIKVPRKYDLAITTEVAEHLPSERSAGFVAELTSLAPVVLFSAAIPYQGGTNHINEQWLEFWALLFREHGYIACDPLRQFATSQQGVEFWFSQNLVVFANRDFASNYFGANIIDNKPLSLVHPLTLISNVSRYRPLAGCALDLEFADYRALVTAIIDPTGKLPPLRTTSHGPYPRTRIEISDPAETEKSYEARLAQLQALLHRKGSFIDELSRRLKRIFFRTK